MLVTFVGGPLDGQTFSIPDGCTHWNAAPPLEPITECFSTAGEPLPEKEASVYTYRIVQHGFGQGRWFEGVLS